MASGLVGFSVGSGFAWGESLTGGVKGMKRTESLEQNH